MGQQEPCSLSTNSCEPPWWWPAWKARAHHTSNTTNTPLQNGSEVVATAARLYRASARWDEMPVKCRRFHVTTFTVAWPQPGGPGPLDCRNKKKGRGKRSGCNKRDVLQHQSLETQRQLSCEAGSLACKALGTQSSPGWASSLSRALNAGLEGRISLALWR